MFVKALVALDVHQCVRQCLLHSIERSVFGTVASLVFSLWTVGERVQTRANDFGSAHHRLVDSRQFSESGLVIFGSSCHVVSVWLEVP